MRRPRGFRTNQAVAAPAQPRMRPHTQDAPIGGWVTSTALARPVKRSARRLINGFPTSTGVRPRGGASQYADLGADPVESLWNYASGVTKRMYAAIAGSIWDVSGTPSEEVTGQTSDIYSTAQFDTGSGGNNYQYVVNGADKAQLFDGTSFQQVTGVSTPIAISGVDTALFAHVWVYRSRLYFIERNSLTVWYMPLNSVGGTAQDFTLSGAFKRGGKLVFGTTWSIDSGAGADDKWVVMTDQGEAAVFEGADPGAGSGDLDPWRSIGVYDISELAGSDRAAVMHAAGDPVICTVDGLVPLSQVLVKDPAALSVSAVSRQIEPDWKLEGAARSTMPWTLIKWPQMNMAIVGLPVVSDQASARSFVVNLQTGAWGEYLGWNIRSGCVHNGQAYAGTDTGLVIKLEDGGQDLGENYVFSYIPQFEDLGAPGVFKQVNQARITVRGRRPINIVPFVCTDYGEAFPTPPNVATDVAQDVWDTAIWDEAVWDAAGEATVNGRWMAVTGSGYAHALGAIATIGGAQAPDTEVVVVHATSQMGELVV